MTRIDTHAHLISLITDKKQDPGKLCAAMRDAGVGACVNLLLSKDESDNRRLADAACHAAGIRLFHVAGIHPHDASKWDGDDSWVRAIAGEIIAVGEIGMDLHYDFSTPDDQVRIFRRMLELAVELGKPVVIHGRKAEEKIFDIINEYNGIGDRVLFHCYTGTPATARRIFDRGWSISLPGIVTFPNADDLREVLRMAPDGQVCFETDSPYLAPVPHRGKMNQPAYVSDIYNYASQLTGLPTADWEGRAARCFSRVFGVTI
ncbi:MAG TPA: TatD family hydrolase [bacterium]|nr:TatD family hydrolase [bacterium]